MFKFLKKLFFGKKEEEKINTMGCYDEQDERTFGAEVIAGQVTRADLTDEDFKTVGIFAMIHQAWTDFCVACSGCYSKEASEGKGMMSWPGAYALACRYIGMVPAFGMSILAMMKARVKYGIPEYRFYPFNKSKSKAELANWRNMSREALENAKTHRDKSYFQIRVPIFWSKFDTFRAYLNKFRREKIVINTGADDHAISLCEQKTINGELRIGGPDSYGPEGLKYRLGITINGWRYFTKAEVAQFFNGYIGFDMDRGLAELLNEYNGRAVKIEESNECWLIKDGKRRYLGNEAIAWAHNTLLFDQNYVSIIKVEELNTIPQGPDARGKEGDLYPVAKRMLEKAKKCSKEEIEEMLIELNK